MITKIFNSTTEDLINDWANLWENSEYSNYINSPEWFFSTIENIDSQNTHIISIYDNNNLIAIATLLKQKKYGFEFYTFPADNFSCGMPFLIKSYDKKVLNKIISEIKKLENVFMTNIPEYLVSDLKLNKYATFDAPNFYVFLELDSIGEPIIRHKNKIFKKAKEIMSKLNLKTYDNNLDNKELETIFKIDNKSTKKKFGYNVFSDNFSKKFYKSLKKHYKEKLILNILTFNKKPIAYEIGFKVKNTYYGSQIANIEGLEKYSIGRVFVGMILDNLTKKQIKKFDFGSGDDHIKRTFTKEQISLFTVIITQNKLIDIYLKTIIILRKKIYDFLHQHKNIYSIYRKIKK